MMEFSKEQQNMHYGWIRCYAISAFVCLIVLQILQIGYKIFPDISPYFDIGIIIFVGSMVALFIFISLCCELFTYARKQKQRFSEEGRLEISIHRNHLFPFASYIEGSIERTYTLGEIKSIGVYLTHITIKGEIHCERYDKQVFFRKNERKKYQIKRVRIPRNFTNEHLITKLDIRQYNQIVRNIAGE